MVKRPKAPHSKWFGVLGFFRTIFDYFLTRLDLTFTTH